MNYQETINWMFSQLPMYQQQGKSAFKKDLTNTVAFAKQLNNPELRFQSIHVGGTNGKGSTSHMLASILQEAGYKVGLYTSPHLKSFTERIRINGNEISKDYIGEFIRKHKSFLEKQQLSFFEMTVGLAFQFFADQKVDIAIIEVGMGGRLDSTNIITPLLSIITNIGLDHTQFLGETLPEIALEKAGIIKKNIPVIIGEKQNETTPVFLEKAKETNSSIYFASDNFKRYKTDLLGNYQQKNANTVVNAIQHLQHFKLDKNHIDKGLANVIQNTKLKGRWQILQDEPKLICDTAHNREGLQIVMDQLSKEKFEILHIVLGVVSDKDLAKILNIFPKNATYYFCKPNISRGLSEIILQKEASEFELNGKVYSSVKEALVSAQKNASKNDIIYIGGSTFVVAEII